MSHHRYGPYPSSLTRVILGQANGNNGQGESITAPSRVLVRYRSLSTRGCGYGSSFPSCVTFREAIEGRAMTSPSSCRNERCSIYDASLNQSCAYSMTWLERGYKAVLVCLNSSYS